MPLATVLRFRRRDADAEPSPAVATAAATAPIAIAAATAFAAFQLGLSTVLVVLLPIVSAAAYVLVWILAVVQRVYVKVQEPRVVPASASAVQQVTREAGSTSEPEINRGEFEIYLRYRTLPVGDFAEMLRRVENIYQMVDDALRKSAQRQGEQATSASESAEVATWLAQYPEDRLELAYVATGASIKARFRSGWLPALAVEGSDVVVEIPRPLASAALTGYLLITAAHYGVATVKEAVDLRNAVLQGQKLEREIIKLDRELVTDPRMREYLDEELRHFQAVTVRNAEFTGVTVKSGPVTTSSQGGLTLV